MPRGGRAQDQSPAWPADKVERRPIEKLIPYAKNARTHSPEQVAQIAASMREWGWTNPVLVDEKGTIIAGHARVLAARQLGITEIPVMVATGWSDTQRRAYVLADNQLALNAGWDVDMLRLELQALTDLEFDTSLLGFDDIDALLAEKIEGLTDPDDAPVAPVNPVTRAGDLWQCGRHRVLCGDATSADDVEKALGGVKPHLMVTDPPYGVEYDADWRSSLDSIDRATGKFQGDGAKANWDKTYALFSGDVAYVWHAGLLGDVVANGLRAAGFQLRAQIIWVKPHFVISRGDYHSKHEPCWYAVRKRGNWQGDRTQSTVWEIANRVFQGGKQGPENERTGHSTQKPVECMRRPIVNNSSPGQAVYDPFLGSGTTMIAAEMEGRSCLGLEISPAYCDVIVKRWQAFTGNEATLDGDGRTFAQIDAERFDGERDKNSAGCYDDAIAAKRKALVDENVNVSTA